MASDAIEVQHRLSSELMAILSIATDLATCGSLCGDHGGL